MIRKVYLKMNEELKYKVIKKLIDSNGNKQRAAIELGCTVRHINRMIKGYKEKGTCGIVIKAFNNDLYFCVNEKVYVLELLPEHVPSSKNFDLAKTSKVPKKHYIPPMSHPWKGFI